jgi:NAD(P)H-dependent FMN reductase
MLRYKLARLMPSKPQSAPAKSPLNVLAVVGSLNQHSTTSVVIEELARLLKARHCAVDILDFRQEPLPLYNPNTAHESDVYPALRERVDRADVLVLGTPDYHGSISSVLKSFLDHFWREFAGKLFATVVSSHEKGLTVTDQLRTVARQCYAWSLPYGISFVAEEDVTDDKKFSPELARRLGMAAADIAVYGRVLSAQRRADLASTEPGFMARLRKTGET